MEKIDFVILWVDGSDKNWQKDKNKYDTSIKSSDVNGAVRYRDWDNLKYWFRGVEKYAPWVNNIYFITYGHLPKWLNTKNPKLKIIKHEDYIPKKYLPTFSSNPIELNIHRVKSLSEHFVLFNDDMFLINNVSEKDFFENGLPKDNYNEVNMDLSEEDPVFAQIVKNNYNIVNKHYNKLKTLMFAPSKFINIKYGLKRNLQTIKTTICHKDFVGINNNHIAQAYLKSYFKKIWDVEPTLLDNTSSNRFRSKNDINIWLIRYFQLLDKMFVPRDFKLGKFFTVSRNNQEIIDTIKKQKYKMVCINDSDKNINFDECKNEINSALEYILPNKSTFEK